MKNYFIITLLLFSVYFTQAQIVNIPDANFKNALINTPCVDTDGDGFGDIDADTNDDGEIQESEAEAVLSLEVRNQSISSLEGVQSFSNLVKLDCGFNQIISLNVTQNQSLEILRCNNNHLTSLDIAQNSNLEWLYCNINQLSSLDVSQNSYLKRLLCSNNLLTSLDVTQNLNLERYYIYNNQLTSINVSENSNLKRLDCDSNQLTNLDVSQNPNLLDLYCGGNQLTSLDVSQNLTLEKLSCYGNQLTNIDVSQNPNLFDLYCGGNQLTSLDIKNENNHNMTRMKAFDNPNLTCIQVDDVNYANSQICEFPPGFGWCKDDWAEYSEDCNLGLSDFELYNVKIYPNPVQNTLNINSDIPFDTLKIYNIQGQLVLETKGIQIDISQINSGLFFASIMIDRKNIVKKFIKN